MFIVVSEALSEEAVRCEKGEFLSREAVSSQEAYDVFKYKALVDRDSSVVVKVVDT